MEAIKNVDTDTEKRTVKSKIEKKFNAELVFFRIFSFF